MFRGRYFKDKKTMLIQAKLISPINANECFLIFLISPHPHIKSEFTLRVTHRIHTAVMCVKWLHYIWSWCLLKECCKILCCIKYTEECRYSYKYCSTWHKEMSSSFIPWSLYIPILTLRKETPPPSTHWIVAWVGFRISLSTIAATNSTIPSTYLLSHFTPQHSTKYHQSNNKTSKYSSDIITKVI